MHTPTTQTYGVGFICQGESNTKPLVESRLRNLTEKLDSNKRHRVAAMLHDGNYFRKPCDIKSANNIPSSHTTTTWQLE